VAFFDLILLHEILELDLVAMHPEALDGLQMGLVICLKKSLLYFTNSTFSSYQSQRSVQQYCNIGDQQLAQLLYLVGSTGQYTP
jgi:hypothetical protein